MLQETQNINSDHPIHQFPSKTLRYYLNISKQDHKNATEFTTSQNKYYQHQQMLHRLPGPREEQLALHVQFPSSEMYSGQKRPANYLWIAGVAAIIHSFPTCTAQQEHKLPQHSTKPQTGEKIHSTNKLARFYQAHPNSFC